eukprot:CAMPEP_0177595452 /NCGR_PEP_ID=MMETSP0419_2-20121207/10364_1 /TAXON_ID=582737 /ORGANISM="Tetraselmis sp., Strain GSL018" /LENGTH=104 /DNA_ID=CAMNT_0019086913 /DNA_START=309 /DNA_END=620 /DNA_ORIENTATION=-
MRVKPKKTVEVPSAVKAFIERAENAGPDNLAGVLEEFDWQYDKGDFNHWVALLNLFDKWLEENVKPRKDLQLEKDDDGSDPRTTLAILRVTTAILENCNNKHLY